LLTFAAAMGPLSTFNSQAPAFGPSALAMPDPLLLDALHASRYYTADPATSAEVKRNENIALLNRALAERANEARQSGTVLPLRAAGRR
jgi:hypothetical protein